MNSATRATTTAVILFTFKPFLPWARRNEWRKAPADKGLPGSPRDYAGQRAGVHHLLRRGPAPPRGGHRELHVPQPAYRVGVGVAHDLEAGRDGFLDVLAAEIETVRQPVHLEGDALLERHLERALEVQLVLRAAADVAALGVAEAAHVGVPERRLD